MVSGDVQRIIVNVITTQIQKGAKSELNVMRTVKNARARMIETFSEARPVIIIVANNIYSSNPRLEFLGIFDRRKAHQTSPFACSLRFCGTFEL